MRAPTSAIAMIDLLAIAFLLAEILISTWENLARSFRESARHNRFVQLKTRQALGHNGASKSTCGLARSLLCMFTDGIDLLMLCLLRLSSEADGLRYASDDNSTLLTGQLWLGTKDYSPRPRTLAPFGA